MSSSTVKFPASGSNDTSIGEINWTNPSNITAEDASNARAQFGVVGASTTRYLKGLGFGFSIPSNATITGIKLEVKRSADHAANDWYVYLVQNGVIGGTNKALGDTYQTDSVLRWIAYGGDGDLWGRSWSYSDINASNFGAVFSSQNGNYGSNIWVDAFRITVYYTTLITVSVAQVTETDTATQLAKRSFITQDIEIGQALAIIASRRLLLTAVESETATAITKKKKIVVAQVYETDIAPGALHYVPLQVQGIVGQVSVDDRLAIQITHANGSVDRWGPDEPDGMDVPNDLAFSTSIPGGFKEMSCSLSRDLSEYSDESLFDDVLVYGAGFDAAWEGRMAYFPRQSGSGVKPSAVGYVEHLRDDPTASDVWIDRDLGAWTAPSTQEIIDRYNADGKGLNGYEWAKGADAAGNPGLIVSATGPIQGTKAYDETWFDAGAGNKIKFIRVASITVINAPPLGYGGVMVFKVGVCSDDHTWGDNTSWATKPASINYTAGTPQRYAAFYYQSPGGGSEGTVYGYVWRGISLVGDHGLTLRGSDIASDGFYVSDLIADIVSRWAPLLNFTHPGSIETTTFVVPHFSYRKKSNAYVLVAAANAFELMQWGVYRGGEDNYPARTFFLRQPNPDRLTWKARLSDGARVSSEGVQAEEVVNGVVVNFKTYDGVEHSVGPPGSTCEFTDASLVDLDPENPVNAHSIPGRYGILNVSQTSTLTIATQLGAIWLNRRVGIQRRGSLTLAGKVLHPSGIYLPTWRVRAGDYVIVEDANRDTEPRAIVNTSYKHSDRTNNCDLEHPAFRLDALMEQWGVELIEIGVS